MKEWEDSTGNELSGLPAGTTPENTLEERPLLPEPTNHEREERQPVVPEDTREQRASEEISTSAVQRTRTIERGTFGVDFAEQTDQRQVSLSDRKNQMLQKARK